MQQPITPALINEQNQKFWDAQYALRQERMADEGLYAIAVDIMQAELDRQVPWITGNEFDKALETAIKARRHALHQRSMKGGKASKGDALHDLILEIYSKRPAITTEELYNRLVAEKNMGVIEDIDDEVINFKNHDGKSKKASTVGLKDRLSRIRKSAQAG